MLATRELHSVEPSGDGHAAGCLQAKIILTRTQLYDPLRSPNIDPVSPGSAKSDEADRQGHIGGFLKT